MNSRTMHPSSPLKHPPPPPASGGDSTQPYPYRPSHHRKSSLSSLNTIDRDHDHHDSQLTHLPITSFTVADPQALMSRMAAGPSPAASASHSPASSRTKGKAKMLDKFGSLGKKVVKEVLGGTGNNPAQSRGDVIPTFGRGGAARPKVRVYGATPMPHPATKSLGAMGSNDSAPGHHPHPSASVAVQVDTVISAGNNTNNTTSSSASSGLVPTTSSPLPPTHHHLTNLTNPTSSASTDTSFRFADPSASDDVVPDSAAASSVRPHSDHPFVLVSAGAGSTARGGLPNLGEGAGRLDDPYHLLENGQNPLLQLGERASLLLPSSTSCLLSHRTRSALQSQDDFISMLPTHHQSRSPSPRQRSLSPPPPRVPPLPLETKPKVRSASNPPPFLIRDDFEFLNFPPDQQQQQQQPSSQLSQFGEPGGSGSGSGAASRRSSRRLGRRISVATSNITYTTARSKSRPRTAFTTTSTTRSFTRRAPPLHLQLDPTQVFYPRPQLPEQAAYGSGLLDRDEEESVVLRYDTPAGVVSEWRGDEDGGAGQQRRAKNAYRLSSPMEFPPTPSSGSFDLGGSGGSNTALGRSRTVTPGGTTFATTTTSEAEFDDRGRSRLRGPRRPVSVAGSVQETFGAAGNRSGVVSNLPAPSEPDPLPEEGEGQRRTRRPLPSVPVQHFAALPRSTLQQTANSSSGSLPSLSLPIHHPPPLHHHQQHQLGSSASHASTRSRSSLGGLSETQSQSDAASSSIASANALLIQNALKLLAGGAPAAPPPVPPPVVVPPLQPVQQFPPMAALPTAAVPPTSVLGLGMPISPFVLPQAQPPQLPYGPMSPLMGGLGAGMSLPSIPGLPMQPIPPTLPQQQLFSPQLPAGMLPTLPLSPPMPMQQPLPLGVPGLAPPPAMGGQYPQALELLIALANQNLRLMAAVEQQRLEQQLQQLQLQNAGGAVGTAGMDLRRETRAPPAPSTPNPDEGLGLQTSTEHLQPSASTSSPRTDRRRTRTSLLSTSTAPSNFTATGSNSSSSNSSQSKRASGAHSQQTPTPPVSPRPSSAGGFPTTTTPSSPAVSTRPPSFKARISTPKLGGPFRISLSTVLGREGGEGSSTRGLATPVEEVPPPVPPLPASLVGSATRAQPPAHAGSFIDTRPSTALSDYEADDDEERKRERPHSWLAEVRGWEELVLGDLAEEAEGQDASSSSAARAMAGMGELKSPGLFSVSTSTTAAESSMSGSTRKNTFDEERAGGEAFGKVPFPRSRSRPRELGFASAGYAMKMGNRGRTLSSLSRVGPEMFERDARVRDSIDSIDSVDSTASSNGGAMDLEELSFMTAHVFS